MRTRNRWFAAVCGAGVLASPVCAEPVASLRVYGVLDTGILSQTTSAPATVGNTAVGFLPTAASNVNAGRILRLRDGGIGQSYWGLRGEEDLGGGTSAFFRLQSNLLLPAGTAGGPDAAGATTLFNQYAMVGMAGALGSLSLGRQVSPIYDALALADAREAKYFGSVLTGLIGMNVATGSFAGNSSNASLGLVFTSNAIVYTTPSFHGLSAGLQYSIGGVAGNAQALRQEAVALTYRGDPWLLSAFYYAGNDDGQFASATPNGTLTNRLVHAGARYRFGRGSIGLQYFRGTNPVNASATGTYLLGGTLPVFYSNSLSLTAASVSWQCSEATLLSAGVYHLRDENNTARRSTLFALGVDYALSRRTSLYLQGASVSNVGSNMAQAPLFPVPVPTNMRTTAVDAGIRHSF